MDANESKEKNATEGEKEVKGLFICIYLLKNFIFLALGEEEIAALKSYNLGPYSEKLKQVETGIQTALKNINTLCGIKESDTGLAPPALWDLIADKTAIAQEQPLQVFRSLFHKLRYILRVSWYSFINIEY
jgi:hypothetical protein